MKWKERLFNRMAALTVGVTAAAATIPVRFALAGDEPAPVRATLPGADLARAVTRSLGDPARFNWESVVVDGLRVRGGDVSVTLDRVGDRQVARVRGPAIFAVRATGHGDRNSPLDVEAVLTGLDVVVPLDRGTARVEADLRVINRQPCRVWTRAKNQKVPFGRVTFRLTAIPRPFDVRLKAVVDVSVKADGTVALMPRSWRPVNPRDRVDIQISGQKLPNGWATISPLDAPSVRVDMDVPFGIGDRTIRNPLHAALSPVIGREFVLGRVPR